MWVILTIGVVVYLLWKRSQDIVIHRPTHRPGETLDLQAQLRRFAETPEVKDFISQVQNEIAVPRGDGEAPTSTEMAGVLEFIHQKRMIEAVKRYRMIMRCDLKTAQQAVAMMARDLQDPPFHH